MVEGDLAHVADGRGPSGRDDIVVGHILLQHQPHGAHIVLRMAPVTLCVDIAEAQFLGQAKLDARHGVGDLAGDELDAAKRRFMVEQDAARCVQTEALAIIDRQPMSIELCYRIGRAWVERRRFGLHRLLDEAVHFRGRRLVEARIRFFQPNRLQNIGHAEAGHLTGQNGLLPRRLDEGLCGKIVDFVRLDILHGSDQAGEIQQIAIDDPHVTLDPQPFEAGQVHVRGTRTPCQTVDLIALVEAEAPPDMRRPVP